MDAPTTLQQAIIYFSDAKRCNEFMVSIRWADGKAALRFEELHLP